MYTLYFWHHYRRYHELSETGPGISLPKKSSCTVSTSNDNWPWKADDNGKSFGFGLGCKVQWISLDADMNWYTNAKAYNTAWTTDMRRGTRIDAAKITLMSDIRQDSWSWGKNTLSLWGWIGWIGNFGGRRVQQWWHSHWPQGLTANNWDPIEHTEDYEANGMIIPRLVRTPVSWSSLLLRARNEYESPKLLGDAQYGLSAFGSLDMTLPFRRRYAETNIIGEVWVRGQLDRLRLDVSVTKYLYRELPISRVIRAAENNPEKYATVKISWDAWKGQGYTVSPYVQLDYSLDNKTPTWSKRQGTAGASVSW
jgi:hypothetical protein